MASSIHNPPSKYLCLGSNGFQKLLAQFRSLIELMIDFHVDELSNMRHRVEVVIEPMVTRGPHVA